MSRKSRAAEFAGEGYKIHVAGRNVLVTDSMKDYAIEKVSKIERFTSQIIDVVVTMDIQKIEHRVDIVMKAGHLKVKAQASSNDMYASIDKAVAKIERQLRRYKTRLQDHTAKRLSVTDMNVNVVRLPRVIEVLDINDEIEEETQRRLEEEYRPHEIVMKETKPLKMLTYEEAIMKMELSGDAFLIFKAEDDNKLKVIYRREDEDYGIIDPQ